MPMTETNVRHGGALKLPRNQYFGEVSFVPPQSQCAANKPVDRAGTAFAVSNLTTGVPALSAGTGLRGGARNSADRVSWALSLTQIANLTAAVGHADKLGLPLNRMITIHWQAAGVPLPDMAKATGWFLDLLTKALARHGSKTAWLWVHENVPGSGADKGGHCHLLVHIPPELVPKIARLQRGWLRRITGQPYRARVIRSKPIGGLLGLEAGILIYMP